MWIHRDISPILEKNQAFIQILLGLRQCGKTSLFHHLGKANYLELSLDDLNLKEAIAADPMSYIGQFSQKKLIIDEAQDLPSLFPTLKRLVDLKKRNGDKAENQFRLTGSNQIILDEKIKESLAGRALYFNLHTLSVSEVLNHFQLPATEILFRGGWPELYREKYLENHHQIKLYLDNYIRSAVEKDIVLTLGIQKQNEFMKFLRLLAGRTGCLLNYSELSKEVGVSNDTIKDWISILERMNIILLVPPYFNNLSKRLVKSPKVYFLDTGICCRLQGHSELLPMVNSPQMGLLFETLVCGEIYKTINNFGLDWKLFHWRSRDGEEIDFYIEISSQKSLFIEVKVARKGSTSAYRDFPEIKKVFSTAANVPDCYLCYLEGDPIDAKSISIAKLRDFLLSL